MSFADTLLSTGERILHREKQHWWVFVWGARFTILAVAIAAIIFVLSGGLRDDGGFQGGVKGLLGWVTAILFFGGLLMLGWTVLAYRTQEYVLTNRRVLQVSGVLNKRSADSSLEKINDAVLTQSFFGRIFDFGDLEILTAADVGIDVFRMVRGPIDFKKAMLDAKHSHELEMEQAGQPPSPPLRTDRPAATPPAASDPAEVTAALASLADLRDRGAITPEEYEAKKAELLGRL